MRDIKFRAIISGTDKFIYGFPHSVYKTGIDSIRTIDGKIEYIRIDTLGEFTGLKDKNGTEGYFNYDIWEIKDYDYSVIVSKDRLGNPSMRQTKKIDLRFILKQGLLEVECEIINKPEDLRKVSLAVLFNLKRKDGTRLFVDEYRKRLEIIGNKFENPELLNN